MSYKVYTGFRLALTSLADIQSIIVAWRDEMEALHEAAFAKLVAGEIADRIDKISRSLALPAKNILSSTILSIWDRQRNIKRTDRRDPDVDFEFLLRLFPFEGRVYGIAHCEQNAWLERWLDQPFLDRFNYWDNSDKPDQIDEDEWADRQRIWCGIFAQHPSRRIDLCGLNVSCTGDVIPSTDDILQAMPPFSRRLAKTAEDESLRAWIERNPVVLEELKTHPGSCLHRYHEWRHSEAGVADFATRKDIWSSRLHETISPAMLTDLVTGPVPTGTWTPLVAGNVPMLDALFPGLSEDPGTATRFMVLSDAAGPRSIAEIRLGSQRIERVLGHPLDRSEILYLHAATGEITGADTL